MIGFGRKKSPPARCNLLASLSFCLFLIVSLMTPSVTQAAYTYFNTIGTRNSIKITDMSGSFSSSGGTIVVKAWDASGNVIPESTGVAALKLYNNGTTTITGSDLATRFPTGTPILYSLSTDSSKYIITNVTSSTDGTLNIPNGYTIGTTKFVANSVGSRNSIKITDMSGSLSTAGAAIAISAWDASGNTLTESGSAAPLKLYNNGTTTIAGPDLIARFPAGIPMAYEFTVDSSKYIITNVKSSADGSINIPYSYTSGTTNFVANSIGPRNSIKITDMSGSLSTSGAAITITAWGVNGNAIPASTTAAALKLYSHGTTAITGPDLIARFPTTAPMAYEFTVDSSKYIITNVKSSADGTINSPYIYTSGTTTYASNDISSRSTIKISDASPSMSSSGAAITVAAWDVNGTAIPEATTATPLTLYNNGTITMTGNDLIARFPTGTPALYEFAIGSSQYIVTNVTSNTEDTLTIPSVYSTFQLDQIPSEVVCTVNMNIASGYLGSDSVWYNLLGKGDINGDGYEDLVIGLFRHTTSPSYSGREYDPSGEIKPFVLFYNQATDTYEINQQLQSVIRKNQHPRQVAIADFDGDGRNDVFIGDHGYDDHSYGNQNTLLLNKVSGFVDGTSLLPQYADYSHGLVMGDFDGNGRPDLLVMNNRVYNSQTKCQKYPGFQECSYNPPQYFESYVLFNRGTEGLNKGVLDIPNDVINFTATTTNGDMVLYVGHSADFNKDGIADIVVSTLRYIFIVESAGVGKYAAAQVFSPPAKAQVACNDDIPYSAINSLDMDGDGVLEIIASYACHLSEVQFQVFKRASSGVWYDATTSLVGDQTANTALSNGWCYKIEIYDVNNDGTKDVICQSIRGQPPPTNNVFWYGGTKLQYSGISLQDGAASNFYTVVQNKAGTYILGLSWWINTTGQYELVIRRWKIK